MKNLIEKPTAKVIRSLSSYLVRISLGGVIWGAIRVDGHNVKDFRREDLRCMFGMVLQDTWLYNDTIMENIRCGRPEASDEEFIASPPSASSG